MNKLRILAIIFISLFSLSFCGDAELEFKNVTVKVLGHSGKIQIAKNYSNGNTTTEETVTINFSALKERDAQGNEVGKTGSVKHSFNNFAQLDFAVSEVVETKFQNLTVFSTTLKASKIVKDETTFTGSVLIFAQDGEIVTGINETAKVTAGAIKFSVDVEAWPFCDDKIDPCEGPTCCQKGNQREAGAYLDFELEIKGQKEANKSLDSNSTYHLGNSDFILSEYIKVDGEEFSKLPVNYPVYEKQGEKDIFTFRFPVFKSSVSYDPLVVMNPEEKEESSNAWLVIGIVVGIVAIAVVVFLVIRCFNSGRKSETLMP
jgi:hypothetical protein